MDIAAMSMAYSQAQVMQQASLAVASKAMDMTEIQMQGVMDMLPTAQAPSFGQLMDIRA